jgi:5-methylcytosine-specific restriction endonuclease McrA
MTKSEYRRYVQSEQWLQRRKLFLSLNRECQRCGISSGRAVVAYDQGLHVHHKNYQRVGAELDSDLEALCRRCHEIETFGSSALLPAHLDPAELEAYRRLSGKRDNNPRMTEHGLEGLF